MITLLFLALGGQSLTAESRGAGITNLWGNATSSPVQEVWKPFVRVRYCGISKDF